MPLDRKKLFSAMRKQLFGGSLQQQQVEGVDAILDEWEKQGRFDLRYLAYILATVFHETATTMQPIEEYGKGKNYDYGKKLKMGKGPGKRVPYSMPDKIYYGRGHTQNTWYENHEALTRAASDQGKRWDFLNHPELLLQMEPSLWATFHAMQTGLYTGRKLADYFKGGISDWVNARKIINGLDKAELIAGYGRTIYQALLNSII